MANPEIILKLTDDQHRRDESLNRDGHVSPGVGVRTIRQTQLSSNAGPASQHVLGPLTPSARLWLTLGPLVGFVLILGLTALLVNPSAAGFLASIALGTFVGGGKLMILAGAVEGAPLGTWALAALIVYVDLATAMVALGGMYHLFRLPGIGRALHSAQRSGWRVLQHNPWMYRVTWLAVAGFIAVPFQATGAFVGVVIGRLLGLSRWSIVAATGCGSLLGSVALALAGDYWQRRISAVAGRPLLALALVLSIVVLTVLTSHFVHKLRPPQSRSDILTPDQQDPH